MKSLFQFLRKRFLLVLIAAVFFAFFYFDLHHYISFNTIKAYQLSILAWTQLHYAAAIMLYVLLFTVLIACAIPCATLLTLLGGFLFGNIAIFYAIFCTTLGGVILFLIVRNSIGADIMSTSNPLIQRLTSGFRYNAFNYLLSLRLVPIMPCWVSNIGAGAMNVPLKTFIIATVLGITPATIIYVFAGKSLDTLLLADEATVSKILLTPSVLLPLIGLALLSIFPVIYKKLTGNTDS